MEIMEENQVEYRKVLEKYGIKASWRVNWYDHTEESKLNSEKIGIIWKKARLNSDKIGKIWKKP
jgi:hypothetical protein